MGLRDGHAPCRGRFRSRAGRRALATGVAITVTLTIVAWALLAFSTLASPNVFDPFSLSQTATERDPGTSDPPGVRLHVVTSLSAGQTLLTPVVGHARIIYLNYDGSDDPAVGTPGDNNHTWLDHDDSMDVPVDPGWVTHDRDGGDTGT